MARVKVCVEEYGAEECFREKVFTKNLEGLITRLYGDKAKYRLLGLDYLVICSGFDLL